MLAPRTIFSELDPVGHDRQFEPRPATDSTAAQPGSAEKVAVLAARLERGESLWHPGDNLRPLPPLDYWRPGSGPGIREIKLEMPTAMLAE